MFRFADPEYLWLLLLIPLLVVGRALSLWHQRKKMLRLADVDFLKYLSPELSKIRRNVKFVLILIALALIIIILARPQMGTKISTEKRKGIETIIALDISNSMMAEDVVPSRLEKSKLMIENLVDRFSNDRIGLIVFAGDAFVQLPLTNDAVSAKMFLHDISPSLIESQGTDIGEALRLAIHSFSNETKAGKAIVVITDGEDHEGHAEDMAKEASKAGISLFVLGVGKTSGAPIPLGEGDYLTDNNGQTVMTALNETMCQEVAAAGKGTYIHVDNTGNAEQKLDNELSKLQKQEFSSVVYSDFDEQFQAFAVLALLLLVAEALILEKKGSLLNRWHIFKNSK